MNCSASLYYIEESASLDHPLSACCVSTLTLNRKLLDTHTWVKKLWGLWLLSGRRRKKCDKIRRFLLCFINLSQIFVSQDVCKPKKPKSISDNGVDKKDGTKDENSDDEENRKREWGQA